MKSVPFDTLKYVEAVVALGIPEACAKASCASLLKELAGDAPETLAVEDRGAKSLPLIHGDEQRFVAFAVEPLKQDSSEKALPTQDSLIPESPELEPPEVDSPGEGLPTHEAPNVATSGDFLESYSPKGNVRHMSKSSRIPPIDDTRLTTNISRGHHAQLKMAVLQQGTTAGEMIERWIDNEIKCWNVAKYGKFHLNG